MKKKFILLIILFCLSCTAACASTLYRIRFGHYPEKIRAVFDFDGGFTYETDESKKRIIILLKETAAGPEIPNYVELNDLIVRYFEVEKEGEDLKVSIPLAEPIDYNIFYLNDPPRLIVDFGREFLNIVSGGTVADGIEYLKVKKGIPDGHIKAHVLRIDLNKAEVMPALAGKQKPNIFDSLIGLIFPWTRQDSDKEHFYLDRVSRIVSDQDAVAGINGTFFASSGSPLGALVINRELVSSPIYDRTAFFLDEKNSPYIDNIFISSYFKLKSGTRYKITAINQGRRGNDDNIIYTPAWGKYTGTDSRGMEIVVSKSIIKEVNISNSRIPENGYVLSIAGPEVESLAERIKVGDKIEAHIKIIPYTASPKYINHLISGGPRLLKHGRIYVSKYGEKFKTDIAKGRAARTAIGITSQKELLLITVDGPSRRKAKDTSPGASIGASLEELSNLLLGLGAVEAVNLDGGGSSTMVVENQVVNRPNSKFERRVSNALVVRSKK